MLQKSGSGEPFVKLDKVRTKGAKLGHHVGPVPLHPYLEYSVESPRPVSFHQVASKSTDEYSTENHFHLTFFNAEHCPIWWKGISSLFMHYKYNITDGRI